MGSAARELECCTVEDNGDLCVGRFRAMGSPCEVLLDTRDRQVAEHLTAIVQAEARRIEHKFSRYRSDNVVWEINHAAGRVSRVDEETAAFLDFADECHRLSGGLFDITSGCLRRAWRFDGSDRLPSAAQIRAALAGVGWQRVRWQRPELQLAPEMEIDFGGIGKEYAVDRALQLARAEADIPLLVNFGGDLAVSGTRRSGRKWLVGIEDPAYLEAAAAGAASMTLDLSAGALATSGDSHRYLLRDGVRYGHVLDPFTGWPIRGAPRSVTVAAPTCVMAGMLATFGLLHGEGAESFLQAQGVAYWCLR